MQTANEILLRILEIVDYQDDKDKFVESFLKNITGQTFFDLVKTLPDDKQKGIELKEGQSAFEALRKSFSEEQIQEAEKNASSTATQKFLEEIYPSLSEVQKGRLENFLKEVKQANPTIA